MIENLFASDLAFLQDLYRRINQDGGYDQSTSPVPTAREGFAVDVSGDAPGGS